MLTLTVEHPAELIPLVRAMLTYLEEQPELPAEHAADVRFIHDEAGRLVSVVVELGEE